MHRNGDITKLIFANVFLYFAGRGIREGIRKEVKNFDERQYGLVAIKEKLVFSS